MFDLRWNYPVLGIEGDLFARYLRSITADDAAALLRPAGPDTAALAAGAAFLAARGLPVPPETLFFLAGGHHALSVILTLLRSSGGAIAVDPVTYPNFLELAASRGTAVLPCASDAHGITPHALRAAFAAGAKAVYLMPTVHNPTGAVMPLDRRRELAAVVDELGIWVIEDDAYGFLAADAPPPLAAFAPRQTFYIFSFSKPFAPGLKAALLTVPPAFAATVEHTAVLASSGTSALFTHFAQTLLASGQLEDIMAGKRQDAHARQTLARTLLPHGTLESHPTSYHLWVHPHHHTAAALCTRAEQHGVLVSPGAAFAPPGTPAPNAFRIALGAEPSFRRLQQGLEILAKVMAP